MNRDLESRIEQLERKTGICLCNSPLVSIARTQAEADAPAPSAAGCPLHPGERRHIIVMKFNLDDEPAGTAHVGKGLDGAPQSETAPYPAASHVIPVLTEAVSGPEVSHTATVTEAPQTPQGASGAPALLAPHPGAARASPPVLGPLAAALGPADAAALKQELRLGLADLALRGVGIDPDDPFHAPPLSEQPDCARCGHPSRVHSTQVTPRRCLAVMTIGPLEVHGPCQCRAYERSR